MNISMQHIWTEFFTIALIHILAVISPGPDLAVTLKHSVQYGRTSGIWTSIGIGAGIFVHVFYSIIGLGLIISQSILLFNLIKFIGAFYLIYVGIKALKASPQNVSQLENLKSSTISSSKSFNIGFITNVLNPKATLFFLAVFSVTVSPDTPSYIKFFYGLWMSFATAIWFSLVTLIFTKSYVRNAFNKFGHWFERTMGIILIGLGIRLCFTSAK
jgi:RhtB (resistance to homoserine/threonine) family protein